MNYRPEVDGLRAIAVIPVVLFHAEVPGFSGGFIGVDIFFVISGYLITTIISKQISTGSFSFFDFYCRRARRLLPALFLVLAVTLCAAYALLMPWELEKIAKTSLATMFFAANVQLMGTHGYFDQAAETNPLLHMWSLSVEEQFYLIFPPILILCFLIRKNSALYVLAVLSAASLAVAELGWRLFPEANFYLLPSRFWELGAGGMVALWFLASPRPASDLMAFAGVVGIALSVVIFSHDLPAPSVYMLLPVASTALILVYGSNDGIVGRLLSSRGTVGVGLISYSLYLWHQPIIAYARLEGDGHLTAQSATGAIALAVVFAVVTYMYVEKPFRRPTANARPRLLRRWQLGLVASGAILSMAAAADILDGVPQRFLVHNVDFHELERRLRINHGLSEQCDPNSSIVAACSHGDDPSIALWGDSYAMHLADALRSSPTPGSFVQLTRSACAPITDIASAKGLGATSAAQECLDFNREALDSILTDERLRTVVIASAFSLVGGRAITSTGEVVSGGELTRRTTQLLRETLDQIRSTGRAVVMVSPTPSNGTNIGECLLEAALTSTDGSQCDFALPVDTRRHIERWGMIQDVVGDNAIYLDQYVCPEGICNMMRGGTMMYRDTGHLSIEGSIFIGKKYDFMRLVLDMAERHV